MTRARPTILILFMALCLVMAATACGSSNQAARKASMADEGSAVAGGPQLTGISTEQTGRQTTIALTGSEPLTYTAFSQDEPSAIIIDVNASASPQVLGRTMVRNGTVDQVEAEQVAGMDNLIRVKIGLTQVSPYQIDRLGDRLVCLVENAPGTGATPGGIAPAVAETSLPSDLSVTGRADITNVGFEPVGQTGRTRLLITTSKPIRPSVAASDQGRTVVVSVSPAGIAPHLTRALDTSYFNSAVNYVKPARVGQDNVNFVVRLREAVPYHLGRTGNTTYVEFDKAGVPPKQVNLPKPQQPAAPASGTAAAGQSADGPKVDEEGRKIYIGQKISLDFQNADIHNILRLIREISGKNLIISDRVKGKVTLSLKEVPWDQALDVILERNNLALEESGGVISIDTKEYFQQQKAKAVELRELEKQVEVLEPQVEETFTADYVGIETLKSELDKLLTPDGNAENRPAGTSQVIGNRLYVKDAQKVVDKMKEVKAKIDEVVKQILIESRIVEASSDFSRTLGISWGGDYSQPDGRIFENASYGLYGTGGGGGYGYGSGGTAVSLGGAAAGTGLGLGFSLLSDIATLNASLSALEDTGEVRIVSAPRIMAQNDQEVSIKQGEQIPYTSTSSDGTETQFKDAALELRVKPHIEANQKMISMQIDVTKNSANYGVNPTNPPISTKEAHTKLMVRDGETVVIGGIIQDEKQKSVEKVPGLADIPILGYLFKNNDVRDSKTELLIFLTAHIIPVQMADN